MVHVVISKYIKENIYIYDWNFVLQVQVMQKTFKESSEIQINPNNHMKQAGQLISYPKM